MFDVKHRAPGLSNFEGLMSNAAQTSMFDIGRRMNSTVSKLSNYVELMFDIGRRMHSTVSKLSFYVELRRNLSSNGHRIVEQQAFFCDLPIDINH